MVPCIRRQTKFASWKTLSPLIWWVSEHEVEPRENGTRCLLQVGVRDWESLGTSPSRIQKKKGLVKQWQKSWMPKWKGKMKFILPKDHDWRNESLHTSRPRSSHRISILTSVNFFGQVRILLLLQFSGTVRQFRWAAVRRGYPVMRVSVFELWR